EPAALPGYAAADGALQFDTLVAKAPAGTVKVGFGSAALDVTRVFASFAGKPMQTVTIPLACFTSRGANLASVDSPFSVDANAPFTAVFGNIRVVGGAAREATALACADLK